MIFKFLNAVTADTTGATWTIDTESYPSVVIQVSITTAASVTIQGRIPGIAEWITLNDGLITTDKAISVIAMPEMRAVATAVNGALSVYGVGSQLRVLV